MDSAPRSPAGVPYPQPPEDLSAQVEKLVQRVQEHPEGMQLLRSGYPDSVAALFGISAYVVTETRKRLLDQKD